MSKALLSRWKASEPLVRFLLLIPASIALAIISSLLHNLIYALFILILGDGFWESSGIGEEPVFFLIAVIVAPVLFLIGVIGSAYHIVKKLLLRSQPKDTQR